MRCGLGLFFIGAEGWIDGLTGALYMYWFNVRFRSAACLGCLNFLSLLDSMTGGI